MVTQTPRQAIRTGDRVPFAGIDSRRILNAAPCCKRHAHNLVMRGELIYRASLAALALVSFVGALVLSAAR